MDKNKWAILGGGVLIIFIIGLFYFSSNQEPEQNDNIVVPDQNVTSTPTSNTTTTSTEQKPTTTVKTPTATKPVVKKPTNPLTPALEYQQALTAYRKSGYYIQFYPCQATPGSLVVKKDAKVMLDNRDKAAHVIGIGTKKYNIAAYNFTIATLSTIGTNYVTCDGGGRAVITVQP